MRFQLPLALLLIPATTACVTDSKSPHDPEEVQAALEKEDGGYDMTDEAPTFAADDQYAAAAIEADVEIVDTLATDPEMVAMNNAADVEGRNVIVVWGRLPADPNATEVRDWSGELRLNRGGMLLRRRIAFEDVMDRVHPRTRRDVIAFDSRTRPFADGLALTVLDPTPTAAEPLTLTYASRDGLRTYTVNLRDLVNGPIVVDAGDGNKLVTAGRRRPHANDPCEHGFVRGRWHALAPSFGVYLGIVANADGDKVGHLRGIYGERRNGNKVFFGKFINREGQARGIYRGTYDEGKFDARWLTRDGDHGHLHGVYFRGETIRAGGFIGRWAETSCERD